MNIFPLALNFQCEGNMKVLIFTLEKFSLILWASVFGEEEDKSKPNISTIDNNVFRYLTFPLLKALKQTTVCEVFNKADKMLGNAGMFNFTWHHHEEHETYLYKEMLKNAINYITIALHIHLHSDKIGEEGEIL